MRTEEQLHGSQQEVRTRVFGLHSCIVPTAFLSSIS
jgi:hypothetical protein